MKDALLIVGQELRVNKILLKYIFRHYKQYFLQISNLFFTQKSNANLPFLLEQLIKDHDVVNIYSHKDSFTLVNKILSTLSEDTLSLKNDILIPSKVTDYDKNSYLLSLENCKINVLYVKENDKLPNILFSNHEFKSSLNLIGIDEDSCELLMTSIKNEFEITTTSTQIVQGWIKIEAVAKSKENLLSFEQNALQTFKGKIFIGDNPFEYLVNCLNKHDKTISVAESCTGGLIASNITKIAGSSQVFNGSLVSYSNEIKSSWLGVDDSALQKHGAVSEAVVMQMLDGGLKASLANICIAISGIAGPDGGSEEKPVGTIFFGVADDNGKFLVERLQLNGDRQYIQNQSAYSCLRLLFDMQKDIFL